MKQTDEITTSGHIGQRKTPAVSKHSKVATQPAPRSVIRRILVPVDFSPASLAALDYAADRARESGAAIILLHVLEPMLAERRFVGSRLRTVKAEARFMKKRLLFLAKRRVDVATLVKSWLLNGEPGALILEAAAKAKSDLIIMGSVGKKGLRRLPLGSVAEHVIRNADCPVTIVRAPRNQKPMQHGLGAGRGKRAAVVLMGPPGSGKTTLARALAERTPISIIEVGNLLKREVQRGTMLGKKIERYTSVGELVPLAHVTEIVSKASQKTREDIVLFDGMPRATSQILPFLEMLDEQRLDLCAVIILTLDLQTALDRLVGRRICKRCGALHNVAGQSAEQVNICERCGGELIQRQDDREEIVRERFERFEHETLPVIEFFKKEFDELTWEQSATTPAKQRIERVWCRLGNAIPPFGAKRNPKTRATPNSTMPPRAATARKRPIGALDDPLGTEKEIYD
jgi:adenylate kinase